MVESIEQKQSNVHVQKATFAAGCFWGVEAGFRALNGVVDVVVGYTGGHVENPTYEAVCSGKTGHAEAVEVVYDPEQVSYAQLLAVLWQIHNPTQRDGQGLDTGTQYRSAIFYHTDEQRVTAESSRAALETSGLHGERTIVTEIKAASIFWRAEEYHQRYAEKHGGGHC